MNNALILDCYGGPALAYGALGDVSFTAPSGGTVTVTNAANLRDPVASKVAVIDWALTTQVVGGANNGYFGPILMSVSGPARLWSGNSWALVNTTLPSRTRVEQSWGPIGPPTYAYAGGPFLEPVRGVQRCIAFSVTSQPFSGYPFGNASTTTQALQVQFFMGHARGRMTIGRLFIGAMVQLGSSLSSERTLGAVDYAPRAATAAGATSRRLRNVARTRDLTLQPTGPLPAFSTDGGPAFALPVLLDLLGTNSHTVLAPGAIGASPRGDGPECMYGLFRGAVELASRPGDRQGAKLTFVETF